MAIGTTNPDLRDAARKREDETDSLDPRDFLREFESDFQEQFLPAEPESFDLQRRREEAPIIPPGQEDEAALPPNAQLTSGTLSFSPPAQDETAGLSFTPENYANVSAKIAEERARDLNFALGRSSPGRHSLFDRVLDGQEPDMRDAHARTKNLDKDKATLEVIQRIAASGVVTKQQMDFVRKTTGAKETPDIVFENEFAKNFVDHVITGNDNEVFVGKPITQQDLSRILHQAKLTQDLIAQNRLLNRFLQEEEDAWKNSAFYSQALDIGAGLIPFWAAWRFHNAANPAPTTTIWPGGNLEEQVAWLRGQPLDKQPDLIRQALASFGSNQHFRVQFMRALVGYSTDQKILDNFMLVADTLGTFPYRTTGRLFRLATREAAPAAAPAAPAPTPQLLLTDQRTPPAGLLTDQRPAPAGLLPPPAYKPNFVMSNYDEFLLRTLPDPLDTRTNIDSLPTLGDSKIVVSTDPLLRWGDEGPIPPQTTRTREPDPLLTQGDEGPVYERATRPEVDRGRLGMDDEGPVPGDTVLRTRGPTNQLTGKPYRAPFVATRSSPAGNVDPLVQFGDEGPIYDKTPGRGFVIVDQPPARYQFRNAGDALTTVSEKARRETAAEQRIAFRDAVRAMEKNTPEEMLDATGDVRTSAAVTAAREVARRVAEGDAIGATSDIWSHLPGFMNPRVIFGDGMRLAREQADRIIRHLTDTGDLARQSLSTLARVERQSETALLASVKQAQDSLKDFYRHLNDAIVEVVWNRSDKDPANINTVSLLLGKTDGSMFANAGEARQAAIIYGIDATPRARGTSFVLDVRAPIRETDPLGQALQIDTKNQTPVSMANMFLGFLRSSEDLTSYLGRANKHTATTTPQELVRIMSELAAPIGKLSRQSGKALERILEINRDMPNPHRRGQRGWFYQTQGELERGFQTHHNRLPTAQESGAYWSAVAINDLDWTIRNLGAVRDLARQGVEEVRFGVQTQTKGRVSTGYFKGRREKDLPWGDAEDAAILRVNDNGTYDVYSKHAVKDTAAGQAIKDDIKNGYKVIQVAQPLRKPLKDSTGVDDIINFVVIKDHDRKMLGYKQIDYTPGGHSIYPWGWWVKQAITGNAHGKIAYFGDRTIFNFRTQAEAEKYAKAMDTARDMYAHNHPGLANFLANNLPYNMTDFARLFQSGHLHKDRPILTSYSGRSVYDTNPSARPTDARMIDYTKSKYNLEAGMDKTFLADRDQVAQTIREGVANGVPIYNFEPAKQLNPFAALHRGSAQAIRSRWMNDHKFYAAESFIQEFSDVMSQPLERMRQNPLHYLYDPEFQTSVPPHMRDKLAAAQNSRRSTINFIGQPTEFGQDISWIENKILNSVYERFGQKGVEYVPDQLLEFIKDPAKYARSIAFHSKLGIFNPVQLIVQSQSMFHAMAVGGRDGFSGAAAGVLNMSLRRNLNPATIDLFDNYATSFGWKRGEFRESYETLQRTGFYNVGSEVAYRDDVFDPKLWNSGAAKWLDKGTFFFREGERLTRLTAWHTAFHEFRKANPLKEITNRDIGEIRTRADLMSVNMTRASNAAWQNGLLSVPTQFLSFNARLAEQMIGKKLTVAEKARALAAYSALYGVPTAAAATLGVWPFYDDVRQAALERGVNMDNYINKGLMSGLPNLLISVATGREYNLAQRLGPGGSTFFRDLWRNDKPLLEIAAGPGGKIMHDIVSTTVSPWLKNVMGYFGDEYPVTARDWSDIARNVATFEAAHKTYFAAAWGKYYTKRDIPVDDVTGMDSVFVALGLTPMHVSDTFLKRKSTQDLIKYQNKVINEMSREMDTALKGAANNDWNTYETSMKRLQVWKQAGDFSPSQEYEIWQKIFKRGDLADQAERNFIMRAPGSQFKDRLDEKLRKAP